MKNDAKGLGMKIVHKIVDAYGWKLDLKDESPNTTFTIIIPKDN
jgi:signal transduction histidine kinase